MNVRLSLDQSIFTSRKSFETVARSAGVGADERRELETRASYPRNWAASAPLIFRAFPLTSAPGDFAVVRARFVDADATLRRFNFLVHSYVVRKADVDRVDGNLAWLSTYLGCARKCPAGPAMLHKEEVVCDPSRAFRFLRLVVPELSKDRAGQILTHLLSHLAEARIPTTEEPRLLALSFGTPPPDEQLRHWLTVVQRSGEEPLPLPAPDVLNAWRLSALLAVLPRAFRDRASFSINEVSAVPGFALVIQQAGPPTALPPVPVHPFVERCLAWVENDRLDDVEALVTWLSGVMVAPSIPALADLTTFYEDIIVPLRDGESLDWSKVVPRWRALPAQGPLRCESLMMAAKSCLAAAPVQHQVAIVLAASELMAASGGSVDDEIVEAAFGLLGSALPFATRCALQSNLPPVVQRRLWLRAERGMSMAARGSAGANSEEWLWLLVALAAQVYDERTLAGGGTPPAQLFRTLVDAARCRCGGSELETIVEYLVSLARAPIDLGQLRPLLADHIRFRLPPSESASSVPNLSRTHTDIVAAFLDRTVGESRFPGLQVDQALDIVIDFVRACWDGSLGDGRLLAHVLLAWPSPPLTRRLTRSIRRVTDVAGRESARLMGSAYRELLEIRCDPETAFLLVPPLAHRRWLARRRARDGWRTSLPWRGRPRGMERFDETAAACFYRNVRHAVRELDPALGLALGLEYAEYEPGELFGTLIELMQRERDAMSDAWRRGDVRFAGQRVSMAGLLARLVVCTDSDERRFAAVRSIAGLGSYREATKREELALALAGRGVSLERIEQAAGLRSTGHGRMGGRK